MEQAVPAGEGAMAAVLGLWRMGNRERIINGYQKRRLPTITVQDRS